MPNLLFNVAALTGQILILFTFYGLIDANLPPAHRPRHNLAAKAILFSLVGIYTLYAPVELMKGVIADPRGAIVACATLYGGRLVGLATTLTMIGFRLFLGGAGAFAGFIFLAVEYLCLLFLLQPALERWLPPQSYRLLLASTLAMSLLEPLSLLLIPPWELGWQLMRDIGPALGLLQTFATPLLGALLKIQSERSRLIAELRANQIAFDHAQEAVLITDAGGRLQTINKAFTTITGFTPDEILGQPFTTLGDADHQSATYWRDLWETMVSKGGWQGDAWYRRRTGERYPVWLSLSAVRDASGNLTHCVGVFIDITERRTLEEEVKALNTDLERKVEERTAEAQAAKQAAEAASAAKSQFVANMSHEIRTPMNAVLGLLGLLADTRLDDEQAGYVHKVRQAAAALLQILNDILDLTKLDAGAVEIEQRPFALGLLLRQSLDLFSAAAQAKGVELGITNTPVLSEAFRGDALRLGQVLNNLVGNAIKFTDRGRVQLSVLELEGPAGDGELAHRRRLRFAVRDSGIGLSAEQAARLFQPFSQADETTTRRFGGSGLGLSISKRLVELMGGEIGVDAIEGEGSTFWFTLSLAPADPGEAIAALAAAEPATASPYEITAPLQGAELLLVEDNPTNQQVALAILGKMGLRVTVANHGREALERLQAQRFDLVLMDLHMPVMDGLEATTAIRAADWGRDIPIIALTAAAFESDRQQVLAAGMNDYLSKPIDPRQVAEVLLCWLPERFGTGQAGTGSRAAEPALISAAMPTPPRVVAPALTLAAASTPARGETPADPPDATSETPAMPADALHIAGFDLATTRQRIGNDPELLVSILRIFRHDIADWPVQFDRARVAAESREAVRLAHTLKGAAANVGATRVRETAAALEAALKQADEPERVDALLTDCLDALQAAFAALQARLPAARPAAAPGGGAIDLAAARADLAELKQLLNGHRLVREPLLVRLRDHLGDHAAAAEFDPLSEQIQAFDFKKALDTLSRLEEKLLP